MWRDFGVWDTRTTVPRVSWKCTVIPRQDKPVADVVPWISPAIYLLSL